MSTASRELVKAIIRQRGPLSTKEIYQIATKELDQNVIASSIPRSNPTHERLLPSLGFLKKRVLPLIESRGESQKIHIRRPATPEERSAMSNAQRARNTGPDQVVSISTWVWRATEPQAPIKAVAPVPAEQHSPLISKPLPPEIVDHLNTRRRRARVGKIAREAELVKNVSEAWLLARVVAIKEAQ